MKIIINQRDDATRKWQEMLSTTAQIDQPAEFGGLSLSEMCDIEVTCWTQDQAALRLIIGDIIIASTEAGDRAEFAFSPFEVDNDHCFKTRGRLLRDWVGFTEFQIQVRHDSSWQMILAITPLKITAGKIAQEEFEAICEEVASHSASALLDVYGKTYFGLEMEYRKGENAPITALQRVKQAIEQMAITLREIATQPAYRLRTRRVREPAILEQGVSDLTLEEACTDPTLAVKTRHGIAFREHVREIAAPHFNLSENRILSGFLHFLSIQLTDLESRLQMELNLRQDRQEFYDRSENQEEKSWWETEDKPRILEMRKLFDSIQTLRTELYRLLRYPFLPRGAVLQELPQSTPLLRSNRSYASAYRTILSHFRSFRVRLGEHHLLSRGKSLPVLYEWWCVLEVLRILQNCLKTCDQQPHGRGSPFRQFEAERTRFVIEFAQDQAIDFEDTTGRLVRLRYTPGYYPESSSGGLAYGLLSLDELRTPDISLEIFPPDRASNPIPELIIIFDAKYTSVPHRTKLEEVRHKYASIGIFATGLILSRQVWALVPRPPLTRMPEANLASYCTVDNSGFWSEKYDMRSWNHGVIQARPRLDLARSPLDQLLRLMLRRAGLAVRL